MKKVIQIVFMLTLVVVLASVAVFFVEGWSSEIISDRQAEEIAEALEVVIPGYSVEKYDSKAYAEVASDGFEVKDFGSSGIIQSYEIYSKGTTNIYGYAYIGEFQGYASTIRYIIGTDVVGQITGYQIMEQGDTPNFGAQIGIPENWEQFDGMIFKEAGAGNFDGLSGATITTNAWKDAFEVLYAYHKDTYGEPTAEQLLNLKKSGMVPAGSIITSYTPTEDMASKGITAVDVASDGTNNVAVIYTGQFYGYYDNKMNTYMVSFDLATNNIISYVTLEALDTEGFGMDFLLDPSLPGNFTDKTLDNIFDSAFDLAAGATFTKDGLLDSLINIGVFHNNEFTTNNKMYTLEEKYNLFKLELFPTATEFVDVTSEKPADAAITEVFEARNGTEVLGYIYNSTSVGVSANGLTFIKYLVGIDMGGNFKDVLVYDFGETAEDVSGYNGFTYISGLAGVDTASEYTFNGITGAPNTNDSLVDGIDHVVDYHTNEAFQRPESTEALEADLLLAYPGADHFVSIYDDDHSLPFVSSIGNVYEAQDATNAVLGYVYIGSYNGYQDEKIVFALGIDAAGTTVNIHIISGDQS